MQLAYRRYKRACNIHSSYSPKIFNLSNMAMEWVTYSRTKWIGFPIRPCNITADWLKKWAFGDVQDL